MTVRCTRGTAQRILVTIVLFATIACRQQSQSPDSSVARGAYLANGVARCFWCHSPLDQSNPAYPRPDVLGSGDILDPNSHLIAPNLTPDPETGLGRWKDAEVVRAIRQGVGRDGHHLRTHPSTYYSVLTDADALSLVKYLRSLKSIRRVLPPSARASGAGHSVQQFVDPARPESLGTQLARGRYLVQLGECLGCHTTTTLAGEPARDMSFGGGRLFFVANGVGSEFSDSSAPHGTTTPRGEPIVASANITQDVSGIPYYTEEMFVRTIRTGKVGGVRPLSAAMPWIFFRNMTDEDLKAVFAYLKTVPPVAHNVVNADEPTLCRRCGRWHGGGVLNSCQ